VAQNYANFYCLQKDIQTSIRIFVHNNWLTQQCTFGNHVTRRGDRCNMRPWSENVATTGVEAKRLTVRRDHVDTLSQVSLSCTKKCYFCHVLVSNTTITHLHYLDW